MATTTTKISATTSTQIRALVLAWLEAPVGNISLEKNALADALHEIGEDTLANQIRQHASLESLLLVLDTIGLKVGRKKASSVIQSAIKETADQIYARRRDRTENPEGEFDKQGRWYPSDAEDCGDIGGVLRGPSRAHPYSYMLGCRSKKHCLALVECGVIGCKVPARNLAEINAVREQILAIIRGA